MVVRRGAVPSPGQIIQGSEGQTSRWPKSARYSLTLLPQLHSRGRFLLIPGPWVSKETPQSEGRTSFMSKTTSFDTSADFFTLPLNVFEPESTDLRCWTSLSSSFVTTGNEFPVASFEPVPSFNWIFYFCRRT